eukprot:CAMPEP_0202980220 /NCGR_PEP_ID=MMETSP1396-20130829/86183_1 /ASSEMBLY_ACC=CAM_ASM_000872 /TAXON_ID= /ORGANISM="Pseudokeronopsis sp., Strain Brazil" /LENGTH=106 /DNA_ID=CAMNT_0049720049 /DNA_START=687 /DNA_END=1007 /DNA_ORIENTATION=-
MDILNFSDYIRNTICNCGCKPETGYIRDHHTLGYGDDDYMSVDSKFETVVSHTSTTTVYSDGSRTYESSTIALDFNLTKFIAKPQAAPIEAVEIQNPIANSDGIVQ